MHRIHALGAGIAGLAFGLACARLGVARVVLHEQAAQPSVVGAGLQLGPNAWKVLRALGVEDAIEWIATKAQNAATLGLNDAKTIAQLHLNGPNSRAERYGAPFACVHRFELHRVLLEAALAAGVEVLWGSHPTPVPVEAWVLANGLWSAQRQAVDGWPAPSGRWAWRTIAALQSAPAELQRHDVQVWLGAGRHVVSYPVLLGGEWWVNLVAFTPAPRELAAQRHWAEPAGARALLQALGPIAKPLEQALGGSSAVTRWPVAARPAPRGPSDLLLQPAGALPQPLLGDAAHPMQPHLAQGAAMALEDAWVLARCLQREPDFAAAARAYAQARWQRCARVQSRSARNGLIFGLRGPLAWARNWAMAQQPLLMDAPNVYGVDVTQD